MSHFCHSCAVNLNLPEFVGPVENYCKYCIDESGSVKPAEVVQEGIAHWMKNWQPDIDDETAMARAAIYMKAMPQWAD